MKNNPPIQVSNTTKVVVRRDKKLMEIITDVDSKRTIVTIGPNEIKKLKKQLEVAGLPPVCIKMQLAIKKMVSIRDKWAGVDPQVIKAENEMYAAYRELVEYNTEAQNKHIEILSKE